MSRMCQVLGVDESSYYKWRKRLPSAHQVQDEALAQQIQAGYSDNQQVYGSPRIHIELREQDIRVGRKRVARRLMCEAGISVKPKRRAVRTTDSQHSDPVAPNLLKQTFEASQPNEKWLTDITAVWTSQGWLYVAAILDVYSRRVIVSAGSDQQEQEADRQTHAFPPTSATRPVRSLPEHASAAAKPVRHPSPTEEAIKSSMVSMPPATQPSRAQLTTEPGQTMSLLNASLPQAGD